MEDWRRASQGELQSRGGGGGGGAGGGPTRSSSDYGKPPTSGSRQPTVPAWEKKFCYVCKVPWGKICETKKVMAYYKNIVQWDDSAGKEAFENAKARFWATINGLPCYISLPDPDIYIDEVDWNAAIDPQLLLDLDKQPPPLDDEEKDGKLGFFSSGWDSSFFANKPVPCTGWGDAEDPASSHVKYSPAEPCLANWDTNGDCANAGDISGPVKNAPAEPSWGNWETNCNSGNAWDPACPEKDSPAEPCWGNWDGNGDSGHTWDWSGGWAGATLEDNYWENKRSNSWGLWEDRNNEMNYSEPRRYGRKWEGGSQCVSGAQTSTHPGDSYQPNNNNWRNCRGRRWTNNANERSPYDKKPLAQLQWNSMHSCGPINRHGSSGAGGTWRWEKPIS